MSDLQHVSLEGWLLFEHFLWKYYLFQNVKGTDSFAVQLYTQIWTVFSYVLPLNAVTIRVMKKHPPPLSLPHSCFVHVPPLLHSHELLLYQTLLFYLASWIYRPLKLSLALLAGRSWRLQSRVGVARLSVSVNDIMEHRAAYKRLL